jgi:hypothetical protein
MPKLCGALGVALDYNPIGKHFLAQCGIVSIPLLLTESLISLSNPKVDEDHL